jgi:hypothetical protein
MAFTFRPEEKHEKILDQLCKEFDMNAKNKVLLWLIENYGTVKTERDTFYQKMNSQERELTAVKKMLRQKVEAEYWLKKFCGEPQDVILCD